MNNKIVVCLGKGGQRDMAESFARKTGAPIVDKPGEYLTIHFDSKGVSLSGFGLTYQGDFAETMMHRVTNGRLQHEMLVKAGKLRERRAESNRCHCRYGRRCFFTGCTGVRGDII